jgi:hypothetical protein
MCETVTLYKNGNPLQCAVEDAAHWKALGWMSDNTDALKADDAGDNTPANSVPAKRAYNRKVQ